MEDLRVSDELEVVQNKAPDYYDKLTIKQRKFAQLYATGAYTLPEISKFISIAPTTLKNWRCMPAVKSVIADIQYDAHLDVVNKLKHLSQGAVQRMGELILSPIDGIAYQASKDVLDRTGHKPKNEIKVDKTVTTVEQKFKELIDMTIEEGEFIELYEEKDD